MDNVKSDVMLALWDAFKREGIRVPYPVREIRVRGGALPVETVVEVPTWCHHGCDYPDLRRAGQRLNCLSNQSSRHPLTRPAKA